MKLWVWRNFKIQVPDEWEALQFSRNFEKGRLVFADRYSFRFELSWKRMQGRPDLDRAVTDYANKLEYEKRISGVKFIEVSGWKGMECCTGAVLNTRFGNFFAKELCLVEAVFIWYGVRDADIEKAVLESIDEDNTRSVTPFCRWKGFGMEVFPAKELTLAVCVVQPGFVKMEFVSRDNKVKESYERYGMVKHWLSKSVSGWLKDNIPSGVRVEEAGPALLDGHAVETVKGFFYRSFHDRVLRKKNIYTASAWICPVDNRLYFGCSQRPVKRGTQLNEQELAVIAGGKLLCAGLK